MNLSEFKYQIKNMLRKVLGPNRALLLIPPIKNSILCRTVYRDKTLREIIKKCCEVFGDGKCDSNTENDIIQCYIRYGAIPEEYFLFNFKNCSHKSRANFLTASHRGHMMRSKVDSSVLYLLKDKGSLYECLKEFFLRDVCFVRTEGDKKLFLDFFEKHKKFIIKPIYGESGKGIEIFDASVSKQSADELFTDLIFKGKYICEELIIQSEEMTEWNEGSVNTIRLSIFINKKGFHILKPRIRFGVNDSIVDNWGSGGLVAVIDEKTGLVSTDGYDRIGNVYTHHPNTQHPIKGELIPLWGDLIQLAEKIHRNVAYLPDVGWDFALNKDKEWVLIEGNWGSFTGAQVASKEGIKKSFDQMFD